MYDAFITVMPVSLWVIAVLEAVLTVLFFRQYGQKKRDKMPFLMGLVAFGLFYDALILALSTVLKEGGLLSALSQLRYVFHLLLIPLTFPICAMALKLKPNMMKIIWLVTLGVMLIGTVCGFFVHTEAREVGGVMRYAQSGDTNGFVSLVQDLSNYVPVFLIIGVGVIVIVKQKSPHLFLSGFLMLAFTLLGIFLGKSPDGDKAKSLMFFISMFGELFMALFFLLYARDKRRTEK